MQVLSRRTKNNPVLVGEPGVGKTAIAKQLPLPLLTMMLFLPSQQTCISLDVGSLLQVLNTVGIWRPREKLSEETEKAGNVILFIDELHSLIGAGAAEGSYWCFQPDETSFSPWSLTSDWCYNLKWVPKYIEKKMPL